MHNPASVLENDTHKLRCDFDIQTDHLISARRPDLIVIFTQKKGTCKIVDFAVPADHRIKLKENEKNDKHLDIAREFFKNMKHESDDYTNRDWCISVHVTKGLFKGLEDLEDGGRVETIQKQHC